MPANSIVTEAAMACDTFSKLAEEGPSPADEFQLVQRRNVSRGLKQRQRNLGRKGVVQAVPRSGSIQWFHNHGHRSAQCYSGVVKERLSTKLDCISPRIRWAIAGHGYDY
mmetsp:Transcript_31423/g.51871  ORF Transcript_31423/g.51871 Transcript_31423/m.51871 type:complete len:110 (+) Transcript_31423:519-848(+)